MRPKGLDGARFEKGCKSVKSSLFPPLQNVAAFGGGHLGGQQVMHPAPDSRLRPPEYNGKA